MFCWVMWLQHYTLLLHGNGQGMAAPCIRMHREASRALPQPRKMLLKMHSGPLAKESESSSSRQPTDQQRAPGHQQLALVTAKTPRQE
jgi:hypothetical protein